MGKTSSTKKSNVTQFPGKNAGDELIGVEALLKFAGRVTAVEVHREGRESDRSKVSSLASLRGEGKKGFSIEAEPSETESNLSSFPGAE